MGNVTTEKRASLRRATAQGIQGERFQAIERMIVAPSAGIFTPVVDTRTGQHISAGQIIGHLSSGHERTEIISPFAGRSGSPMAWPGERLIQHQPVMWLSMDSSTR